MNFNVAVDYINQFFNQNWNISLITKAIRLKVTSYLSVVALCDISVIVFVTLDV